MGKKSKVTVEELFLIFYESQVFNNDAVSSLAKEVVDFIVEADHTFKVVDLTKLKRELMALRIELFNFAWLTYSDELSLTDPEAANKNILTGVVFTKVYLDKLGRRDIWDVMRVYNSAIARAGDDASSVSWSGIDTSLFPGFPRVGVSFPDEQSKREFLLKEREDTRRHFSQEFAESTRDLDCADRCANLFMSCSSWKDGVISQKLTTEFINRLGLNQNLNCEAIFRLQRIIVGLYNGARDFIEIKPFEREYIDSLRSVVAGLKKAVRDKK